MEPRALRLACSSYPVLQHQKSLPALSRMGPATPLPCHAEPANSLSSPSVNSHPLWKATLKDRIPLPPDSSTPPLPSPPGFHSGRTPLQGSYSPILKLPGDSVTQLSFRNQDSVRPVHTLERA